MSTSKNYWAQDPWTHPAQDAAQEQARDQTGQADAARLLDLAEQIRQACITTALNSYEDAAANGLCAEGAWECAVDAMRHLNLVVELQELGIQNSKR